MLRRIESNDYHKNYMGLINIFTRTIQNVTFEEFKEQLEKINSQGTIILVIEQDNTIIASGSLIIEHKLHNNLKTMGHIEDLVVLPKYRNCKYGAKILNELIQIAKQKNCYKIVLCCNEEYIDFYSKQNFIKKGTEMCIYL